MQKNKKIWRLGKKSLIIHHKPLIMGIVNVTPDSFSDGGKFYDSDKAINHGLRLLKEGSDILDIGGESTRPGAHPISAQEEIDRIYDVLCELRRRTDAPISIDTSKPEVAEVALKNGADIINVVLGGNNELFQTVALWKAGIIIMHIYGIPLTMQDHHMPSDESVVNNVTEFFIQKRIQAMQCGIPFESIVLDIGLGFGKNIKQNFLLLRAIPHFIELGSPLMIGHSRKSFLDIHHSCSPQERLIPGLAVTCVARILGNHIFRVHEPQECKQVLEIIDTIFN